MIDRDLAWSGTTRLGLWRIVSAVAIATAIDLVWSMAEPLVVPPHPDAPAALLAFAATPVAVWMTAAIAIAGALLAVRRTAPLWPVAVWLVALALLAEAAAAHGPGPYRGWYFIGAVGLGIVVGRGWARVATRGARDRDAAIFEARCGELGVTASLVACYVGAATSKLGGAGLGWVDPTTLRAVVLAHAYVDEPGLAAWFANAPDVAVALGWATLAIQLGAIGLLVGGRTRTLAAIGLVGFHVGVAVLARIGYWSAVALVLAVGLPWGRWSPDAKAGAESPPKLDVRRADLVLAGAIALLIAVAWLGPWRVYGEGHHRSRMLDEGASQARAPRSGLGPLHVGDAVAGGWSIAAMEDESARVMIVLEHAQHGRGVLWVAARGSGANSPFDRGALAIAYEPPMPPTFAIAATAVADALAADPAVARALAR